MTSLLFLLRQAVHCTHLNESIQFAAQQIFDECRWGGVLLDPPDDPLIRQQVACFCAQASPQRITSQAIALLGWVGKPRLCTAALECRSNVSEAGDPWARPGVAQGGGR